MLNKEISKVLNEISVYLDMNGESFKSRAYEKVSEVIESLGEEISAIYERSGVKALENIPGVGVSITVTIEDLLKTGKSKDWDILHKKFPVELNKLMLVEGLGPKKIKVLYEKLEVKNLADLEKSAQNGLISKLSGFGEKSEQNILRGLEFIKTSGNRFSLGEALPLAREIVRRLKSVNGVERVEVAGSLRRMKETIGDIDILVISSLPKELMDYFVSMPEVLHVLANGDTKSAVKLKNGLQVDVRVLSKESYGVALNYFTGSKDHNIALRKIAIDKGLKLNEYGLFDGDKQIAGKLEEEIYKTLGMQYIEPELREMTGEIEASQNCKLPNLIELKDLKGDLQTQTTWTDGKNSILEMAEAAMKVGLEYIVITDHTKKLAMTNGLDERRILEQIEEINKLNEKLEKSGKKFRILSGSECDILKDGTLDLPDEILEKLDVVGVSVHSLFNLSRRAQTDRVIKAIKNKHADILFHPTGRLINKRPAYDIDMDEIIKVARETGTVLEIDAFPDRLDLKDEYIRKCVNAGVRMSIDSDAHSVKNFSVLEYGVVQARRGWAEKKDIVNARGVEEMLGMLK